MPEPEARAIMEAAPKDPVGEKKRGRPRKTPAPPLESVTSRPVTEPPAEAKPVAPKKTRKRKGETT